MKAIKSTPQRDFFRLPGEFEEHSACWMLWPERNDVWRLEAQPAQKAFIKTAVTIARFEPLIMAVSEKEYKKARFMLPKNIKVVKIANNDSWVRDSGPDFVVNNQGEVRGVAWEFNAYGGTLYSSWNKDKMIARKIIDFEKVAYYKSKMVLEGGAINVDGEGTLLVIEECLLNSNRNASLSKKQIEKELKEYLNVKKIIWFKKGLHCDEAGGHIDNFCSFARPGEVLLHWTDQKNDPQYKISTEAYKILKSNIDAKGRKFKIHKIHQPNPLYRTKNDIKGVKNSKGTLPRKIGERLPASYINFYFANKAVILPIFKDPFDSIAWESFKKIFPDRKIIKVYAREIILGGGGIHCITKQVPRKI